MRRPERCFRLRKITKMKANHNALAIWYNFFEAVFACAKLLKWKRITTQIQRDTPYQGCFRLRKITKMKANHNRSSNATASRLAVFACAKLLKWKRITTTTLLRPASFRCFRLRKITKMKANHNFLYYLYQFFDAVFACAKLLKWKRITTIRKVSSLSTSCFRLRKITKMKANHNS
mgnify:CR=1 FL=1